MIRAQIVESCDSRLSLAEQNGIVSLYLYFTNEPNRKKILRQYVISSPSPQIVLDIDETNRVLGCEVIVDKTLLRTPTQQLHQFFDNATVDNIVDVEIASVEAAVYLDLDDIDGTLFIILDGFEFSSKVHKCDSIFVKGNRIVGFFRRLQWKSLQPRTNRRLWT
jgi:hypothetical protein